MVTKIDIMNIYNELIKDEMLCRFLVYADNPLDENKDISSIEREIKDIFSFSPQSNDINETEKIKIHLFKGQSKTRYSTDVFRVDTVYICIYVPHRIQQTDLRIYDIEEKIANILEKYRLPNKMYQLEYMEGYFINLPPVSGYSQYNMIFNLTDTRGNLNGR